MREVKRRTEPPGDAATVEQREEWRRLVEDFLKNERNLEQAEKQKQAAPSKLNRMATFDLTCACDRQLGLMTQSSWSAVGSYRDVDNFCKFVHGQPFSGIEARHLLYRKSHPAFAGPHL